MATRAGIYARISLDRDGTKESPETQEAICRAYCQQRGWEVAGVYCDRDTSAFKRGVKRPAFDRMLADVDARQLDVVVAFKLDRLTRGGIAGIAPILDRLQRADAHLACAQDAIDTSQAGGEMVLAVLASVGKQESENTRQRVMAAFARDAERGRPHVGGSRQFGYTRRMEPVPEEAELVRELRDRALAGESLRQLATDLNARGVRTSMGNEWRGRTVGQMLRSPRLAGIRSHRGVYYDGTWEPILSREDHLRLLEALSNPSRRKSTRRHLLTGLAVCELCRGNLKTMGFQQQRNGRRFERYQCVRQPGQANCGRLAVSKGALDSFVGRSFLDALARFYSRPLPEDRRAEELARLVDEDEAALVELTTARFVQRQIGDDEYKAAREALRARIEANGSMLDAIERQRAHEGALPAPGSRDDLQAWWDAAEAEQRRTALSAAIEAVVVKPAKQRGGNKFDTDRVAIKWRMSFLARISEDWQEHAASVEVESATT